MHVGKWEMPLGRNGKDFDGLTANYLNTFLRSLAVGLLGIFVPVYLFELGLDRFGGLVGGLTAVAVYVVVARVTVLLTTLPAAKFMEKVGFRWSVLLAVLFHMVVFLLLIKMKQEWNWVYLAAVLGGLEISFYWTARLAMNIVDGHKATIGKEIGIRNLITRGVGVLGPFVGGVIIVQFGFEMLFSLGIIVLGMSALPMMFMKKHNHQEKISLKQVVKMGWQKQNRGFVGGFFGHAVNDAGVDILWPIFVFVVVGGFEQLGAVTSGALVISMVGVWGAGKVFDITRAKGGNEDEKVFVGGTIWVTVMRVVRSFATGVWGIFILDSFHRVLSPMSWVPLWGYYYNAAARNGAVKFFTFREMIYSLGVMFMMVVAVFLVRFDHGWQLIFLVASLGYLLVLPAQKESNR